MPDAKFSERFLRAALQAAGAIVDVTKPVASLIPAPYIPLALDLLADIIQMIQTIQYSNEAFKGLAEDAKSLMTILSHRAVKGMDRAVDVGDLNDVLRETLRFAKEQRSRNLMRRFLSGGDDLHTIEEHRSRMRSAMERFKLDSHLVIQDTLADITAMIMQNAELEMQKRIEAVEERRQKARTELYNKIATGASHDSKARSNVDKCLPGTRELVIAKLLKWLDDAEDDHSIQWIYGPAGCGKTSIAQSMANMLVNSGYLAASFFWSNYAGGSRPFTIDKFVPTISYQLCEIFPILLDDIASALEDPRLFNLALERQMDSLVTSPLLRLFPPTKPGEPSWFSFFNKRYLLLFDGLDECEGRESQKQVLGLIEQSLSRLSDSLPLRVLISSRPEDVIHNFFASPLTYVHAELLALSNEYGTTDEEIRVLIQTRFIKIRTSTPYDDSNWPTADQVDALVEKTGRLFIYADLVMKYIEHHDRYPEDSLNDVLSLSPNKNGDNPLSRLDEMYALILRKIHGPQQIRRVQEILEWIILMQDEDKSLNLCSKLLGDKPAKIRHALKDLRSVIHIPFNVLDSLQFFHASFSDFLQDPSRLKQQKLFDNFSCNIFHAHAKTAKLWIKFSGNNDYDPRVVTKKEARYVQGAYHLAKYFSDLFRAIITHCDALDAENKFYSDTELIHHLQTLNVEKYLAELNKASASTRPKSWWLGIAPGLRFVYWLLEKDKSTENESLFLTSEFCQSFIKYVQDYWANVPPDIRTHIPVLQDLYISERGLIYSPFTADFVLYHESQAIQRAMQQILMGRNLDSIRDYIVQRSPAPQSPEMYTGSQERINSVIWLAREYYLMLRSTDYAEKRQSKPYLHKSDFRAWLCIITLPVASADLQLATILHNTVLELQKDPTDHLFDHEVKEYLRRCGYSDDQLPPIDNYIPTASRFDAGVLSDGADEYSASIVLSQEGRISERDIDSEAKKLPPVLSSQVDDKNANYSSPPGEQEGIIFVYPPTLSKSAISFINHGNEHMLSPDVAASTEWRNGPSSLEILSNPRARTEPYPFPPVDILSNRLLTTPPDAQFPLLPFPEPCREDSMDSPQPVTSTTKSIIKIVQDGSSNARSVGRTSPIAEIAQPVSEVVRRSNISQFIKAWFCCGAY